MRIGFGYEAQIATARVREVYTSPEHRVRGMFDFFVGGRGWGSLERRGFSEPAAAAGGKAS